MKFISTATTPISGRTRLAAGILGLMTLAACGTETPLSPPMRSAPAEQPRFDVFTPEGGTLSVATCTGAAGTYGYHIDVRGGGAYLLDQMENPLAVADIEFVMAKAGMILLQLLLPPSGIPLWAEEEGPLVIIDAMDNKAAPGKEFDCFRADKAG